MMRAKKKEEEQNNTAIKNPKEKIISGLTGMRPGAVLQTVSTQLDSTPTKFLEHNLIRIIVNAAKNGKVKFDAIKDSIKDFNDKNIEDNSKIDWEHVEIDPSCTILKCYFDGDSKKIIDEFMKKYESEMKDLQKDIESDNKKLHDDIKKAKVKIDDEKLEQNSLIVATTLNNDKSKNKSGKELTKEIDQKIEQSNEIKDIIKNADEAENKLDSIKIDPKIANLNDKELEKKLEELNKKLKDSKDNKSDINEVVKILDDKLTTKIGKDYKSSLIVGTYNKEELINYCKKNKLKKLDLSAIKSNKIIGIRVDFFGDESKDVVSEVIDDKAGFVIRKVDNNEKDAGIKKICETFNKILKDVVGDQLDGEPISFLKHWQGKNDDGNFDSLYMFAGVKEDTNESLVEVDEYVKVPNGFMKTISGRIVPHVNIRDMSHRIHSISKMYVDGKIDSTEMKEISNIGKQLNQYIEWAAQNKDSKSSFDKMSLMEIKHLHSRYLRALRSTPVGYTLDDIGRVYDLEDGTQTKLVANAVAQGENGEAAKAASGWKKTLGLDKAFTSLGIARLVAKTTGIVLNNGKAFVDMVGKQAMKYKEDKDIVAEMKILLTNGKDSKTKFEDTKFSVRFDVSDCKWHATCIDNRKMKFPEDKLLKVVFDSDLGKKFKKYCLDRWSEIFKPKDERKAIIPYIIKNAETLGMKNGNLPKEFVKNIKLMSDNFDKIETVLK